MLGRITELNKEISAIKQQKWQVEEKILKLESRMKELEKLCTRSPAKSDNNQLDFTNVKLKEMRNTIDHLVKYLPSTVDQEKRHELESINRELKQLAQEHKEIEDKLTKPLAAADKLYTDLRDDKNKGKLHQMRFDISKKPIPAKVAAISELDGMVSLPIIMQILENIKKINSKAIFDAYQAAFGRKINDDTKRATIEEIWNYCSLDIKREFEKLTALDNLKAENVIQLMNKLSANFAKYLQDKCKLKIINNDHYQKFLALLKTDIYLFCVLETYKFTDSLQMGSWTAKGTFIVSMSENDVVNPYKAIGFCGSAVTTIPDTENLFCELVYWLKGLYLRSFSLIPPFVKDGEKITDLGYLYICDKEDEQFYKYKKLTKIRMAEKHKLHYETLMTKISESKLQLTSVEDKVAETNTSSVTKPQPKEQPAQPSQVTPVVGDLEKSLPPTVPLSSLFTAEELKNFPPIDVVPQPILWRMVNDHYQLTISLHNDEGEKLERLKSEVGKVMEEGVIFNSAEMQAELKSFQDAPDDIKIKKLKECFHKYSFTHTQIAALRVIPHLVREYFKTYSEGKRYWFFANQHSDVARSTIGDIGLSDNPRTHLERLFSLRKELNVPGDESRRLLPQLDKILLTAYDILCLGADKEHEIKLKQIESEDAKQNNGAPDKIKFVTKPNYSQIIIHIPKDDTERWNKLQVVVGKIMEHGVVEDEAKMIEELEASREGDIDEKIEKLKFCNRKYELSSEQQASLGYLSREVDEKFKPYLERRRFFNMWKSTHHGIAETIKNDIVNSEDPRIHLEKLIKLRKTLMKEKVKNRSQNLLPVIDNILLDVYDLLMKPPPTLKHKNSGGIRA